MCGRSARIMGGMSIFRGVCGSGVLLAAAILAGCGKAPPAGEKIERRPGRAVRREGAGPPMAAAFFSPLGDSHRHAGGPREDSRAVAAEGAEEDMIDARLLEILVCPKDRAAPAGRSSVAISRESSDRRRPGEDPRRPPRGRALALGLGPQGSRLALPDHRRNPRAPGR